MNCGMPPQRVLPLTVVIPRIHKALRFYGVQANNSDQNYAVKVWGPFVPNGVDIEVDAALPFGNAAMVEVLVDQAQQLWDPIDIVNLTDLATYSHSSFAACAFYDNNPRRIRFSWNPGADGDQVRVTYDTVIPDPATPDTRLFLPEYFTPMVGVRVSIDCVPDILLNDPARRESLLLRLELLGAEKQEWEKEWDIDRFTSPQQGATSRLPFNHNRPGWRAMRRRF